MDYIRFVWSVVHAPPFSSPPHRNYAISKSSPPLTYAYLFILCTKQSFAHASEKKKSYSLFYQRWNPLPALVAHLLPNHMFRDLHVVASLLITASWTPAFIRLSCFAEKTGNEIKHRRHTCSPSALEQRYPSFKPIAKLRASSGMSRTREPLQQLLYPRMSPGAHTNLTRMHLAPKQRSVNTVHNVLTTGPSPQRVINTLTLSVTGLKRRRESTGEGRRPPALRPDPEDTFPDF